MQDNFEASFAEQFEAIQAEAADELSNLDQLPAALSHKAAAAPFCFPYPTPDATEDNPASILRGLAWEPDSRRRAAAIMVDYCDTKATEFSHLHGVDDEAQLAAARILGVLICAEESAINIFHEESGRMDRAQIVANQAALREIESEERVHNWLIQQARAHYPEPEDLPAIRRRTRRLFMRVASRELSVHFARITGLDSGVCISLSALLGSKKVRQNAGFSHLLRHIRHDEATHVRKTREHAIGLGFDARGFHECYDLTRSGMVDMLTPIASSFEALDVDPDRLFGRLLRFQSSRIPNSAELED